ncbi:MAG: outer membrane protein assembly factor BamB [Verrucomicrobiales bacterium]
MKSCGLARRDSSNTNFSMNRRYLSALFCLLPILPAAAEENWPQFRGPLGTGHSNDAEVPTEWESSNVAWKTELKGNGQSSVVNWGGKLFLTSANADGGERYVHCLDRTTGKILWEETITCSKPGEAHKMNSFATPSCVTDGKNVVAFFGEGGIHCFDLEGNKKWSTNLGDFPGSWGIAASPILVGGAIVQNCDSVGASRIVALQPDTGEIMWSTDREEMPRGGWSTPILVEAGGNTELVLNGEFGVNAYDPKSGKDLWFCKAFNGRGSPMPDFANGLLYVVNGKPGDTYVVKPGGKGDVTETNMVWHGKRNGGRDLPGPAAVGDYVLISSMSGVITCYDAKSGEEIYADRLGEPFPVSASPLVANGLVYFTSEAGETVVVKPGKELEIISRNPIGAKSGEIFRATLSPIQGHIFTRSQNVVYCIGK